MFSAEEILDMAVKIEKNGEAVYREAMKKVSRPDFVSLLKWMAEEEAEHAQCFSRLKQECENSLHNPFAEKMLMQSFQDIIGDQNFSLKDADFPAVKDVDELIGIFIEFEEDTLIFYEMLLSFAEDKDVQARIGKIISEEKQHIEKLKLCIEHVSVPE
ncbi:MAG: ferritin family protein [Desulfococcaceae bacterium]